MNSDSVNGFLRTLTLLAGFLVFTGNGLYAQEEFDGLRGTHRWMSRTDAPNSFYKHIAQQAYNLLDKRSEKVSKISSLSAWKDRQEWLKTTLRDVVGPFPEKTPLNVK